MTEKQFTEMVITRARARGWLAHHCRPARRKDGSWATPISGDPGFVDLVLARGGEVVFRELKLDSGRLTDSQGLWLANLPDATVWKPSQWPDIIDIIDSPSP